MDEVTGPVIAVGLVLSAVFVPAAFIGGITGVFFRQFAVTIAASTIISAFNSLTLSPALAAILLKPRHAQRPAAMGPRYAVRLVFLAVQPCVQRGQLRLHGHRRHPVARQRHRAADLCRAAVGHVPGVSAGPHRLHSAAGQGLSAGKRAVAGRRGGGAHATRDAKHRTHCATPKESLTPWASPDNRC